MNFFGILIHGVPLYIKEVNCVLCYYVNYYNV